MATVYLLSVVDTYRRHAGALRIVLFLRMLAGWNSANAVIEKSAQMLIQQDSANPVNPLSIDWVKDGQDHLEERRLHQLPDGKR